MRFLLLFLFSAHLSMGYHMYGPTNPYMHPPGCACGLHRPSFAQSNPQLPLPIPPAQPVERQNPQPLPCQQGLIGGPTPQIAPPQTTPPQSAPPQPALPQPASTPQPVNAPPNPSDITRGSPQPSTPQPAQPTPSPPTTQPAPPQPASPQSAPPQAAPPQPAPPQPAPPQPAQPTTPPPQPAVQQPPQPAPPQPAPPQPMQPPPQPAQPVPPLPASSGTCDPCRQAAEKEREELQKQQREKPGICGGDGLWHFYNGNCYKFITGYFNWNGSLDACKRENNASLVSIDSQHENEFVASLSASLDKTICNGFWIGMTRKPVDPKSDTFKSVWTDGSVATFGNVPKHTEFFMPPWRGGQPDHNKNTGDPNGEECVAMYPKRGCDNEPQSIYGQWNDYPCSAVRNGAVCKQPAVIL